MTKFFYVMAAIMLLASCSGIGSSETTTDPVADSIAQAQAMQKAAEQARLDSLRQDSIQKEQEKAEFAQIQSMVKDFYHGSVIGCKHKTSKSHLSKYLTNELITKLIRKNEYDDGGVAVWYLRGDCQDCDPRDKVLSVEKSEGNSVIVKFLDCGFTCKVRLYLVKEGDTWKINDYKFLSHSSKSRYPEFNW